MPSNWSGASDFDPERYGQTAERLTALKSTLPEASVAAMARDVLKRLSERQPKSVRPARRVAALAMALTDPDPGLAGRMIEDLIAEGHSVEALYLDFLGPAARRLGTLWDEDALSFTDVTIGTARIYALLRALNVPAPTGWAPGRPSAFFATVPGSEHTLGLRMAGDLFRRRGWQIDLAMGLDHDALMTRFDDSSQHLVGLSAATLQDLDALARVVLALRAHRNHIRVLVAGALVAIAPDAVAALDPDAAEADFDAAFAAANGLFDQLRVDA